MSDYPRTDDDDLPLFRQAKPKTVEEKLAAIDGKLPPSNKTDTSQAAARDMRGKAGSLRRRVYEFIEAAGEHGATDDEIQVALDLTSNTQVPRRNELMNYDLIKATEIRRKTRGKGTAIVYVVKKGAP